MRSKAQVLRDFKRAMAGVDGASDDPAAMDLYSDRMFAFMGRLRVGEALGIWRTLTANQRKAALFQVGGGPGDMSPSEILVEAVTWHLGMTLFA